jgi:hypothetical protein
MQGLITSSSTIYVSLTLSAQPAGVFYLPRSCLPNGRSQSITETRNTVDSRCIHIPLTFILLLCLGPSAILLTLAQALRSAVSYLFSLSGSGAAWIGEPVSLVVNLIALRDPSVVSADQIVSLAQFQLRVSSRIRNSRQVVSYQIKKFLTYIHCKTPHSLHS